MATRQTYTDTDLDRISKALKATPKKQKAATGYTKSSLIVALIKDVRELQSKGYTMKEISEIMDKAGLQVGVATLKSAISRTEKTKANKTAKPAASNNSTDSKPPVAQPKKGRFTPAADTMDI